MTPSDSSYSQLRKVCTKCGEEKTVYAFYRVKRGKYGRRAVCKICLKEAYRETRKKHHELHREENRLYMAKYNKTRVVEKNAYMRKRLERDPEKVRASQRRRYHLDHQGYRDKATKAVFKRKCVDRQWYDDAFALQQGKCAICQSIDPKGPVACDRFAIDHNHACCPNGRACPKCIRGLLCFSCNTMLARIEGDWIRKALEYLAKYPLPSEKEI